MINYEEELKKFKPCLDVDEIERAVYTRDLTDIVDILQEMLKTEKKEGVQPQYLYLMILNALPLFSSVFPSINSSAIPLFPGNQPQQSHHKAVQE